MTTDRGQPKLMQNNPLSSQDLRRVSTIDKADPGATTLDRVLKKMTKFTGNWPTR